MISQYRFFKFPDSQFVLFFSDYPPTWIEAKVNIPPSPVCWPGIYNDKIQPIRYFYIQYVQGLKPVSTTVLLYYYVVEVFNCSSCSIEVGWILTTLEHHRGLLFSSTRIVWTRGQCRRSLLLLQLEFMKKTWLLLLVRANLNFTLFSLLSNSNHLRCPFTSAPFFFFFWRRRGLLPVFSSTQSAGGDSRNGMTSWNARE